jgi:hypothetical protein
MMRAESWRNFCVEFGVTESGWNFDINIARAAEES